MRWVENDGRYRGNAGFLNCFSRISHFDLRRINGNFIISVLLDLHGWMLADYRGRCGDVGMKVV